jgi:DNA-binding MarR family transcriptional regulator
MSDFDGLSELGDLDPLIHTPARLLIMAVLCSVASADFLYLLRETALTRGNLSSHLSRLETAGYIEIEKRFVGKKPHTLCRVTDQGRAAFQGYRERMLRIVEQLPES